MHGCCKKESYNEHLVPVLSNQLYHIDFWRYSITITLCLLSKLVSRQHYDVILKIGTTWNLFDELEYSLFNLSCFSSLQGSSKLSF